MNNVEPQSFIKRGANKVFSMEWISSNNNITDICENWCDLTIKKDFSHRKTLHNIIDKMEPGDDHSLFEDDMLIFITCLWDYNKQGRPGRRKYND